MPISRQVAGVGCVLLFLSANPALAEKASHGDATPRREAFSIEYQQGQAPASRQVHRLRWRFKRVHPAEGAAAVALAVSTVPLSLIDVERHWTGNNAFDDWFRRRLMVSIDKQTKYARASDALVATSLAFPLLVDLVGMALIGDRNKDVGLQMFGIQAQAFAMSGFVTSLLKLSGRERPCAAEANLFGVECPKPNESYFGAHTVFAFTAAGLTCVEHQQLKLFGPAGDPLACASVLSVATLVGAFRVVADRHWMTDELTGAGVGLVSGWLMPWLMHYRHDLGREDRSWTRQLHYLAPYGKAGEFGLSAAGVF